MLKEIYIQNLAVIKEAVIPLDRHLNIFTGETGAGKSILINGINAVLGQRCTKDIVRTGCDKAVITALFTELSDEVCAKLDELGVSHDDGEITVTREISADGGSVSRINQRTASAALLKEIGAMLINIHGQHDNQILLDSEKHLQIMDDFGGDDSLLSEYRVTFRELQHTARRLGELKKQEQSRIERSRTLNEIIDDIGELELREGEDDELEKEYETAKNSEKTLIAIKNAVSLITGDEAANDMIVSAETEIAAYTDNSTQLNSLYDRLSAAEIELADIASELESFADKVELDGQRLEYLGTRLNNINKMKRKYATDCEGLIKLYDDACREIMKLESSGSEIKELAEKREALLHKVTEQAKALYDYRETVAERFTRRVTEELEFLNMAGVIIAVKHEKGKLTVNGMDTVEFLISANKGEEPKPISKIASGGELSRIMLALKSVIADKDSIPTMIFDEIDTGVSGKAAQKIGIKLREIGQVRQVICVTHLSQIAVMADNHLLIEKQIVGDRTETHVMQLDMDGRVAEIARIMGGEDPSDLMLDNARAEIKKACGL
ncbi:DNA repair protein RecN [Ruminococcus flavefaciens]|uniref:DNA repair protein RecN n=1 Tax=Ruminococcus flavefaciens TaxID=1265 RepID=A0A315XW28_RUMFL|nr:DNA repair protein RecN [Ruminococcus flavefaciens]PWJ10775.1 DNA repair protein RecN (Recombination protein N) [Ruminococcus flavefaciens]SSA51351.1 DNA repair protein RecN (Recombination protein N) [Ruminococcus flavefaciens]